MKKRMTNEEAATKLANLIMKFWKEQRLSESEMWRRIRGGRKRVKEALKKSTRLCGSQWKVEDMHGILRVHRCKLPKGHIGKHKCLTAGANGFECKATTKLSLRTKRECGLGEIVSQRSTGGGVDSPPVLPPRRDK